MAWCSCCAMKACWRWRGILRGSVMQAGGSVNGSHAVDGGKMKKTHEHPAGCVPRKYVASVERQRTQDCDVKCFLVAVVAENW